MAASHNGDKGGKMAFAARLREIRLRKRLSRKQFAASVGVTKTTVGNWEAGRCLPNVHRWNTICDVLGTTQKALRLPPF